MIEVEIVETEKNIRIGEDIDGKTLPIDTPIYVRDSDCAQWKPRYFAGISLDGSVLAFNDGATSWTKSGIRSWKHAVLV